MTISKNFIFIVAIVSTASFSTTKASLTLSQVENLIEEKLRDVLSENTALKTDVLILKNANLAFHSKLENTKKNFQETLKSRLKKITRKQNRQNDQFRKSIISLQQVQHQIKTNYSMNPFQKTEKLQLSEESKGAKESFSVLKDKILNLSNKVDTLSKESNKNFNFFEKKKLEEIKDCNNSIQLLKDEHTRLKETMIQNFTELKKYKIQLAKLNLMHDISISETNSTLNKHIEDYESRRLQIDGITTELYEKVKEIKEKSVEMTLSKSLTQSKMSKLDEKLNSLQGFVFVVDERLDSYQKNSSLFINNLEARITENKSAKGSFSDLEEKILNLSDKVDTLSKESNKTFLIFEHDNTKRLNSFKNSIQVLKDEQTSLKELLFQSFDEHEKYKIQSDKLNFIHELSITEINSTLNNHIEIVASKNLLIDALTTELHEKVKELKEKSVEMELFKKLVQNRMKDIAEDEFNQEFIIDDIKEGFYSYRNYSSLLLNNLNTKILGIENTLRAIDVTNEDSLATNVTEELIILKYELDYSIDQTSTLQKSLRPLSCQDVKDANSLAETKFYPIYKSLIDPKGERVKCNMNGIRASRVQIVRNCMEVKALDRTLPDDIYDVSDANQTSIIQVFCEDDWTYFHRRFDGSLNFRRFFNDYKNGFGDKKGEHWLGLEPLHQLTKSGRFLLRVDMKDYYSREFYAEYEDFYIGEGPGYRLHLGRRLSGNIADLLSSDHAGADFSTLDRDQDSNLSYDCASHYNGAFWLKSCGKVNPNSYTWGNDMSNSHMHWGQKYRKNYNMQAMSFKFIPISD